MPQISLNVELDYIETLIEIKRFSGEKQVV